MRDAIRRLEELAERAEAGEPRALAWSGAVNIGAGVMALVVAILLAVGVT